MDRGDVDREPPAAADVTGASVALVPHALLPALYGCRRESDSLTALCARMKDQYAELAALPPSVPPVVCFCVGGKSFAVSRTLVEKDPGSLLYSLAAQHYCASAPRQCKRRRGSDDDGGRSASGAAIEVPGRNAALFGMLLNLLRGYRSAIPEDWVDSCRDEAAYYGLSSSWNARFQVAPARYYFRSVLHNSKLISDSVLGVASDFLTAGVHHIDFSVPQCDRVSVGMVNSHAGTAAADEPATAAQEGHHGAFYWSDGKLSLYLGEPRVVETGFPFQTGALVRVIFDADDRLVRWVMNGEYCVAMERLPAGQHYAFASIAARNSQVTIVAT
ncbi:hypothetical protein NESM_000839800 [Novymonas esmeraldas]|uniref:BTB domain-containing protein n=1 Tax=Novymonas esmeraldas TaxID=1808958 RepID=A0AAW0EYW5_9TRYP